MKNMRALLLALCAAFTLSVSAQNITVSGSVVDSTGEPVIGASVVQKGNTSNGTITDFDGNFSLSVPSDATLTLSYIGMVTQDVPVQGRSSVNVTLRDDAQALDEVVVIGYGTARKKDLTGSVTTVSGAELAKVPVGNVAQAMSGRLAGVQITSADGSPDAEVLIRVRGGGSITGDNSPLFIVDGFPVSSISDIAPNDIEDITVLKDAASTAIYGSQGANGVILITTKGAKEGKTTVSYNGYLQWKNIAKKLKVMDPYEFVMYNYERAAMRNEISKFEERWGHFDDLELYKYQKGTDWQEEMFGNSEMSQSHNISITGGTDKTKFSLSGTYTDDNSLMKDNGYSRFNLNFKLNHEITKGLKLDFGTRISDTETRGVGTAGSTYKIRSYDAIMKAPVNGFYDSMDESAIAAMDDEEYEEYINDTMTLRQKLDQYWRRKNEQRFNLNLGLTWDIMKNLTYRGEGGYDYIFFQDKNFYGKDTSNAINNAGGHPFGEWEKRNSWSYRIANTLTYRFDLKEKHHFDVMVGQEVVASGRETNKMTGKYYQDDITPEKMFASMGLNSGETGAATISSTLGQENRMVSFFGRLNYRFDERYLLTFTLRGDGSSKFTRGNRWGVFPAAAAAWRISEEAFMENTRDVLSNLKLRVSYGQAGNNNIGDAMYETTYKAYTSSKYYGAGGYLNPHYTLNNSTLANPNLKWETTVTRNIGLDFGFFNERLSGTVDGYWNTTKDLLVERSIATIGYSKVQENIGQTSNRGIELTLNGLILDKRDYSLSANFNIGFNRNKVDKLTGDSDAMIINSGAFSTDMLGYDDYRVFVGQPLGLIYGYVYDGYYSVDDFKTYVDTNGVTQFEFDSSGNYQLKDGVPNASSMLTGSSKLRPGSMKFKDLDDDGSIDADNDRTIIGKTAPKFTGGFGINATYKGFDLSMLFNFVYGNKVYNLDKIVETMSYRTTYANLLRYMNGDSRYTYLDRSTGEIITDYTTLKAMNEGDNVKKYWSPLSIGDASPIANSWAVEDGSYLRLQTITLGYTFPKNWTRKFACNQLRVYCTVNNVFTWTNYTGYDPEVNSSLRGSSTSGLTPGADYSSYPKNRSWTAGLNITF
ncbi:MAG: TonB-dependent receptor [Bacteroides sp.]|nr:TonB-dependent receptor [Bacteroides sp.]